MLACIVLTAPGRLCPYCDMLALEATGGVGNWVGASPGCTPAMGDMNSGGLALADMEVRGNGVTIGGSPPMKRRYRETKGSWVFRYAPSRKRARRGIRRLSTGVRRFSATHTNSGLLLVRTRVRLHVLVVDRPVLPCQADIRPLGGVMEHTVMRKVKLDLRINTTEEGRSKANLAQTRRLRPSSPFDNIGPARAPRDVPCSDQGSWVHAIRNASNGDVHVDDARAGKVLR